MVSGQPIKTNHHRRLHHYRQIVKKKHGNVTTKLKNHNGNITFSK